MFPKKSVKLYKNFILISSAALTLPLSVVAGYYIGKWLDRKLSTEPLFLVLFIILFIAAGFLNFFKVLKQIEG